VGHKRIDAKWKETTRELPCLLFELSSLFENPDCPDSGSKRLKKGFFFNPNWDHRLFNATLS